ncbi:MAG: hypothetical protein FWE88_00485 [Phycisphaerae bacterium]|nr:hypothetical protein [Phycisphaerae bacterium]
MIFPSLTTYLTELVFCVFLIVAVRTVGGRWLGPGARRLLWTLLIVKALVPLTVAVPHHPVGMVTKWTETPATSLAQHEPSVSTPVPSLPVADEATPTLEAAIPATAMDDADMATFLTFSHEVASPNATAPPDPIAPPMETAAPAMVESPGPATAAATPAVPTTAILLTLWLLGAASLLGVAIWRNRTVVRHATRQPVAVPDWVQTLFLDARQSLRLGTWPVLIVSPYIPSPCLVGALRPRILIPESLVEQHTPESETRIRHLLLHELVHLKQGDIWLAWLWTLTLAIHWFNPLFWILGRWVKFDCEAACDDRVLTLLQHRDRGDYGNSLLRMMIDLNPAVRSTGVPPVSPMGVSPMQRLPGSLGIVETRSNLERRLTMMKSHRAPSSLRRLSAVIVFLLIGTLCLTGYAQSKPPISADKAKWIGYVEDYFLHNGKDITARKPLAWGAPTTDDKGNVTITYKYDASFQDDARLVIEDQFTFDKNGKFVEVKNLSKEPPKTNAVTIEEMKAVDGWLDTYFRENEPNLTNRKASSTITYKNDDGTYLVEHQFIAIVREAEGQEPQNLLASRRFTFDKSGKCLSHKTTGITMLFADGDPKAVAATQPADGKSGTIEAGWVTFELSHAKADDVVKAVRDQFEQWHPGKSGEVVRIFPVEKNNTIAATASAANILRIAEMIRKLDVAPAAKAKPFPDDLAKSIWILLRGAEFAPVSIRSTAMPPFSEKLECPLAVLLDVRVREGDAQINIIVPENANQMDALKKEIISLGTREENVIQVDDAILLELVPRELTPEQADTLRKRLRQFKVTPRAAPEADRSEAPVAVKIFPLANSKAATMRRVLMETFKPGTTNGIVIIAADERTNSVLVTGVEADLELIEVAVRKLDVAPADAGTDSAAVIGPDEPRVSIIALSHAKAIEMVSLVGHHIQGEAKLQFDARTNSVLLTANAADTERVKELIRQLDVPVAKAASSYADPKSQLTVTIIKLSHADAKEMAPLLTYQIHTVGGSVQADARTNSVIVTCTAADIERVKELIRKLDVPVDEKPAAKTQPAAHAVAVLQAISYKFPLSEDGMSLQSTDVKGADLETVGTRLGCPLAVLANVHFRGKGFHVQINIIIPENADPIIMEALKKKFAPLGVNKENLIQVDDTTLLEFIPRQLTPEQTKAVREHLQKINLDDPSFRAAQAESARLYQQQVNPKLSPADGRSTAELAKLGFALAESDAKIKIAEATLEQKKVVYERLKVAYEATGHGATGMELKLAEQEVTIAEQRLELERIARKRIEADASPDQSEIGVRVFRLSHTTAGEMMNRLGGLVGKIVESESDSVKIMPESRSNSLIIAAKAVYLDRIGELIRKLDVPTEAKDDAADGNAKPAPAETTQITRGTVQKWLQKFIEENEIFYDITARRSIRYGDFTRHDNGTYSLEYTYEATILNTGRRVVEQRFTFNRSGEYVSHVTLDTKPATGAMPDFVCAVVEQLQREVKGVGTKAWHTTDQKILDLINTKLSCRLAVLWNLHLTGDEGGDAQINVIVPEDAGKIDTLKNTLIAIHRGDQENVIQLNGTTLLEFVPRQLSEEKAKEVRKALRQINLSAAETKPAEEEKK